MIRVKPVIIIRAAGINVKRVSTTKVSILRDHTCSPCSLRVLVIAGTGSVCAWIRSGQKNASPAIKNVNPPNPLKAFFCFDTFFSCVVALAAVLLLAFFNTMLKLFSAGEVMRSEEHTSELQSRFDL